MNNENNRYALVTGASSGIGADYAWQLAVERNYNLVVTSRRSEQLEELKSKILKQFDGENTRKPEIIVITADLSKSEGVMDLIAGVEGHNVDIDLLVNNAGFGSLGGFLDASIEWEADMVRVNCLAPLTLTHYFLPKMLQSERKGCGVINVCSTASFQPIPIMATYGATKAFLYNFTRAVAKEVQGTGVTVMANCPGPTKSEFSKVIGLDTKVPWMPGMTSEKVVRQALDGFEKGKRVVINGVFNKICTFIGRHFPVEWTSAIVMKGKKGRLVVNGKTL